MISIGFSRQNEGFLARPSTPSAYFRCNFALDEINTRALSAYCDQHKTSRAFLSPAVAGAQPGREQLGSHSRPFIYHRTPTPRAEPDDPPVHPLGWKLSPPYPTTSPYLQGYKPGCAAAMPPLDAYETRVGALLVWQQVVYPGVSATALHDHLTGMPCTIVERTPYLTLDDNLAMFDTRPTWQRRRLRGAQTSILHPLPPRPWPHRRRPTPPARPRMCLWRPPQLRVLATQAPAGGPPGL